MVQLEVRDWVKMDLAKAACDRGHPCSPSCLICGGAGWTSQLFARNLAFSELFFSLCVVSAQRVAGQRCPHAAAQVLVLNRLPGTPLALVYPTAILR